MKRPLSDPTRLLDLRPQEDPANVARLVRSATRAPAEPVPSLKGRIRCSLRRKSAWRRRYLRAALLAGIIFLAGGVTAAVVQPVLNRWLQRRVEPVAKSGPAPSAARAPHRRLSLLPSRGAEEEQLSPVEPADLPSLPPALAPAPATPASAGPSAALPEPSAELVVSHSPRAEPTIARRGAPSARAPAALPASPSAPNGPSASPALPRASTNREPLRTATLEPPSWQAERWPPSAARSIPAAASSASGSTPSAPPPSASPQGAQAELLPSAAVSLSPPHAPTSAAPAGAPTPFEEAAPPGEQALLSMAVRSLRSEHRPGSALAALDEYVARFPSGSLMPEATRLRTEALLALGHKPAALAELNREPAAGGAGAEESRLVRGELRAAAGRWQEALQDFDTVVRAFETSTVPAISAKLRERFERALWGRASARSHLGDEAGARADLRESLRRFPQGRFAGQAAHLLDEQR